MRNPSPFHDPERRAGSSGLDMHRRPLLDVVRENQNAACRSDHHQKKSR